MSEVALNLSEPQVIVRVMITTDRAIDLFLGDLARRGYSDRTRTTYSRILDKLCDHLPLEADVSKIGPDDCRRFLDGYNHKAAGTRAHTFSVLSSFFGWLYRNEKIAKNPLERLERPRRIPADEVEVTSISTIDVPKLLQAARPGAERNALSILAYLGPRRRAVSNLRLSDYDLDAGTLKFREKGGKSIVKPVPDELAAILAASIANGDIRAAPDDYLVPPEGYIHRTGDRDDRVIWRLVKKVAGRAGIDAHVHAFRAAFAVFYLERNPDDLLGLKELLGHRSLNTTLIYLRRLNKQTAMEGVRNLSWIAAGTPTAVVAPLVVGAGGFEPPLPTEPGAERPGQPITVGDLHEALLDVARSEAATSTPRPPVGEMGH